MNECSQLNASTTIGIPFDFSSDLDVGRRPELKSDEKSKGIPIVVEISGTILCYFFEHVYTLSEHQSKVRSVDSPHVPRTYHHVPQAPSTRTQHATSAGCRASVTKCTPRLGLRGRRLTLGCRSATSCTTLSWLLGPSSPTHWLGVGRVRSLRVEWLLSGLGLIKRWSTTTNNQVVAVGFKMHN